MRRGRCGESGHKVVLKRRGGKEVEKKRRSYLEGGEDGEDEL